jgi:precorrin-6B methylase 2
VAALQAQEEEARMIVKVQMHVLGESVKVTSVEDDEKLYEGTLQDFGTDNCEVLKGNLQGLVGEFHAELVDGGVTLQRPVR